MSGEDQCVSYNDCMNEVSEWARVVFAERMRAVEEMQRKKIAELAEELLRLHWPTPEEITP
jgi:hypothetical protein